MLMNYDTIIFDIDGTLWNACPASAKGWNLGLASLGIDARVTAQQIEGVAGHPYATCVEMLLPGLQEQYPDLLDTLNNREIEVVKTDGGTLYEGVTEGIKILANSYKVFLVSNCQDWYMKIFLEFSGLEPFLTSFDCHGMSGLPKDQMLSRIQRTYCLHTPVYVGDTEGDESAARVAGMDFIHVSYGFGSAASAVKHVDSFSALLDYLEG
ncbi:putative phosphatase [Spirochaeta africana DSM 8902]|uniref:phosphoglycolate phosphatase n=2 Tax=Spirochaeta TaxID=146 RepID=H9ULB1_SPIAZ|nr:putative phosphatase [Spirochaeta africana DSM 8902]